MLRQRNLEPGIGSSDRGWHSKCLGAVGARPPDRQKPGWGDIPCTAPLAGHCPHWAGHVHPTCLESSYPAKEGSRSEEGGAPRGGRAEEPRSEGEGEASRGEKGLWAVGTLC